MTTPANTSRKRGAPNTSAGSSSQRQFSNPIHDRKRLKIQDARAIAVQTPDPALKAGQLDINAFVRSREFEIKALEDAISNSRHANRKRAFQSVPRSMRRRTASHNVKRVPKRLKSRHAKEMADDNTPTVTSRRRKLTPHMRLRVETAKRLQVLSQKQVDKEKAKTSRDDAPLENALRPPPPGKPKFRKRQREKTWLPTHVWHAKRAHMVNRWRYAIAETPTEKSYRQTHRASTLRGAVAWDHSFYGTILLKGREKELLSLLRKILSPVDAEVVGGKGLIRRGKRSWQGWIFEEGGYPTKPIAPVVLLWCSPPPKSTTAPEEAKKAENRSILIRIHPSAFPQLWMTIILARKPYQSIACEDLRFELGSIEVTGPGATNALIACLQPSEDSTNSDSPEDVWRKLRTLTNPSSLPPGAYLGFNIIDPRFRFPPRLPPFTEPEEERTNKLFSTISTWPVDKTQSSPSIFSRETRLASIHSQGSQKQINKRRRNAMPGELPASLPTDPHIPILLLANRGSSTVPTTRHKKFSAATSNAIGSWTIVLPWKWVLPIWYSIIHFPGVRFGGIIESNQIQYENAKGSFPDDFPGTQAGRAEETRKTAVRQQIWEKKPKQKRTAWESVYLGEGRSGELGQGTCCDWDYLIELVSKDNSKKELEPGDPPPVTIPIDEPMSTDESFIPPAGQILPPPSTSSSITASLPSQIVTSPFHSSKSPWTIPASLLSTILSKPRIPLQPALTQETLSKALFTVKIIYLHRGSPGDRARIYKLPSKSHAERDPVAGKIREGWKDLLESYEKIVDAKVRLREIREGDDCDYGDDATAQIIRRGGRFIDPGASRKKRRVEFLPPTLPSMSRSSFSSLSTSFSSTTTNSFSSLHTSTTTITTPSFSSYLKKPIQPGHDKYPAVPGEEDLIGFVSSGNFNLKEGKGMGIGSLAFGRVYGCSNGVGGGDGVVGIGRGEMKRKGRSKGEGDGLGLGDVSKICVVREAGEEVGRLARWEVI